MITSLYDTDFDAWAQQQAAALRAKAWNQLDIEHLAEEVEELRKTERNALRSQLRRLASHLLKWHYQPEKRSESWQATIRDARGLLEDGLETSPSLAAHIQGARLDHTIFVWEERPARLHSMEAAIRPHKPLRGRITTSLVSVSVRPSTCQRESHAVEACAILQGVRGPGGTR
jgi:Domain of unknown function DUF29